MNRIASLGVKSEFRLCLVVTLLLGFSALAAVPTPAVAAQYDPQQAGHPLRVFAHLVYPVGLVADYCLMRPAFWLVQREPMATLFGYRTVKTEELEAEPPAPRAAGNP